MTRRRDGTFVWVTWLSKLMAGEVNCEWAPWFRAHHQDYEKVPSDFDQASWMMEHTRLLRAVRKMRQDAGQQVSVERQNQFQYRRQSGLTLSGMPDLIAIGDSAVTVIDAKTGQQKASDQIQVMIYMYCLLKEAPVYRDRPLHGEVIYKNNTVKIPPTAIDDRFGEQFNYFLDILDSHDPADKMPSAGECRFCDIAKADCPERIEESDDNGERPGLE